MAYFRTLKSGERTLVYTSKDRAIQAERRNYGAIERHSPRNILVPTNIRRHSNAYLSIYGYGRGLQELREGLEANQAALAMLYRRLHATLRYKRTGLGTNEVSLTGDTEYVRTRIAEVQEQIRFFALCLADLQRH